MEALYTEPCTRNQTEILQKIPQVSWWLIQRTYGNLKRQQRSSTLEKSAKKWQKLETKDLSLCISLWVARILKPFLISMDTIELAMSWILLLHQRNSHRVALVVVVAWWKLLIACDSLRLIINNGMQEIAVIWAMLRCKLRSWWKQLNRLHRTRGALKF